MLTDTGAMRQTYNVGVYLILKGGMRCARAKINGVWVIERLDNPDTDQRLARMAERVEAARAERQKAKRER